MLVKTYTVLAISCAHCGRTSFHAISLYYFSGQKQLPLLCDCGFYMGKITVSEQAKIKLHLDCSMCDSKHHYQYKINNFFNRDLLTVSCLETGLDIGFIGHKGKVINAANNQMKSIEELIQEIGYQDYFDHPEVMTQVLEHVGSLAKNNALGCRCGSHNIDLQIFPEHLDLTCGDCGAKGGVFVETNTDLQSFKQLGRIVLSGQEFVMRKRLSVKNKSKRQRK